jgi:hypothetical protein
MRIAEIIFRGSVTFGTPTPAADSAVQRPPSLSAKLFFSRNKNEKKGRTFSKGKSVSNCILLLQFSFD